MQNFRVYKMLWRKSRETDSTGKINLILNCDLATLDARDKT